MNLNLEQLKTNFLVIKDIRNKVTNIFKILENNLNKLKQTYAEFILNNKHNLFVFGLDSFQFQSKLIDIEYEDMRRLFYSINNRMYCEYYKLYKIIVDYIKENINDRKIIELIKEPNYFPIYKDLEPYKQYSFDIVQELHENIIILLYGINDFIINKETELQIHKKKQDTGLNINNFVTTFNFNIVIWKEKVALFISYIDFFHSLHTKYFQRFSMKMNLMYNQISNDINFDETPSNSVKDGQDEILILQEITKPINSLDISNSNSNSNSKLDTLEENINVEITEVYPHDDLSGTIGVSTENLIREKQSNGKGFIKNMFDITSSGMRFFGGSKQDNASILMQEIKPNKNEKNYEHNYDNDNDNKSNISNAEKSNGTSRSKIKLTAVDNMFNELTKQCDDLLNISTHSSEKIKKILSFSESLSSQVSSKNADKADIVVDEDKISEISEITPTSDEPK